MGFNCEIHRGEKISILGNNGCGKSTLLNILIKKILPCSGEIIHGNDIKIAYFDQLNQQIENDLSLIHNISEGSDFIQINNKKIHIVTYLKKFIFSSEQLYKPAAA